MNTSCEEINIFSEDIFTDHCRNIKQIILNRQLNNFSKILNIYYYKIIVVEQCAPNWKSCHSITLEWLECENGYHFKSFSDLTWEKTIYFKLNLNFIYDIVFFSFMLLLIIAFMLKLIPWNVYLSACSHYQTFVIIYLFSKPAEFIVNRLISMMFVFSPYSIALLPLRFIYEEYWELSTFTELDCIQFYEKITLPYTPKLDILLIYFLIIIKRLWFCIF